MEKYISNEKFLQICSETQFPPNTTYEELFCNYKGYILPIGADDVMQDFQTWEVRADDVWNPSYAKSGSTWLQEIICAVMYNGDLIEMKKLNQELRMLFLDNHSFAPDQLKKLKIPSKHKIAEEMTSPRILKTHFAGPLLPPQLWEKKPKILYVIRNPKDLVVSMFHFRKLALPIPEFVNQSFGEFLHETISGDVPHGPWWEHYLFFWKKRHESNVLLLRFEDMKQDLRGHVEKVSKFLGKDFSDEKLDAITDHCSFQSMKDNKMTNPGVFFERKERNNETFMRKGKVGDWKSHFTVEQNEIFTAHIQEKLHGTGLTFDGD